jgi:uncharacterized protein with PIN domain
MGWDELYAKASAAMMTWRQQEKAVTLLAIEECVDQELAELRAKMVEELALAGALANLKEMKRAARPKCPECDCTLHANGQQRRKVRTNYDREIELKRSQAKCPECNGSFFPSG